MSQSTIPTQHLGVRVFDPTFPSCTTSEATPLAEASDSYAPYVHVRTGERALVPVRRLHGRLISGAVVEVYPPPPEFLTLTAASELMRNAPELMRNASELMRNDVNCPRLVEHLDDASNFLRQDRKIGKLAPESASLLLHPAEPFSQILAVRSFLKSSHHFSFLFRFRLVGRLFGGLLCYCFDIGIGAARQEAQRGHARMRS